MPASTEPTRKFILGWKPDRRVAALLVLLLIGLEISVTYACKTHTLGWVLAAGAFLLLLIVVPRMLRGWVAIDQERLVLYAVGGVGEANAVPLRLLSNVVATPDSCLVLSICDGTVQRFGPWVGFFGRSRAGECREVATEVARRIGVLNRDA